MNQFTLTTIFENLRKRKLYLMALVVLTVMFIGLNSVNANEDRDLNKNKSQYLVIAHPSLELSSLSSRDIAEIYALQTVHWENGKRIKPISFKSESQDFKYFCETQLNVQPYQLKRVWSRLLFTGVGTPPKQVDNVSEMIKKVSQTPGAIGYIKKHDQIKLDDVQVIEVEK